MGNIFDILGPVMVGPSSSHTAGAVRIGLIARQLFYVFDGKLTSEGGNCRLELPVLTGVVFLTCFTLHGFYHWCCRYVYIAFRPWPSVLLHSDSLLYLLPGLYLCFANASLPLL